MKKINLKKQHLIQLVFSVSILFLLYFISTRFFFRIDLTSEKRYTISDRTKEILQSLDDVVYIKVYLDGTMPVGFKKLKNTIQETLNEFRIYAGDNIQYEFIDPSENEDPEVRNRIFRDLFKKGVKSYTPNIEKEGGEFSKELFPGAIITYGNTDIPVNFLNINSAREANLNNSEQNIEYKLIKSIYYLTKKKNNIAFLQGHGELNELETNTIRTELSDYYRVFSWQIGDNPGIIDSFKVVVIAKPQLAFSERDKFVLDQYIMNGGKVIWFIDEVNASTDSLVSGSTFAYINSLNLDDQLFTYGVRINPDLVLDINCNILPIMVGANNGQPSQKPVPWLFHPLIAPLVEHPITRNIGLILTQFTSTIDTINTGTLLRKTVLLKTSEFTKVLKAPTYIRMVDALRPLKKEEFNNPGKSVAVLLEGQFKSVFRNRDTKQILNNWDKALRTESVPNKMIVVADGDMIANYYRITSDSTVKSSPLGYDKYYKREFKGNSDFIINSINYLTDEKGLLSLRNKDFKIRLLDKGKIKDERMYWIFINTFMPVLILIVFGIIYNRRRKTKYSR